MSPAFIIGCFLAFVIITILCIYYKDRSDSLKSDVAILRRDNAFLEQQLNEHKQTVGDSTGSEFIHRMSEEYHFNLEETERNDNYVTYEFSFQGGNFMVAAGINTNALSLENSITILPYTHKNYEKLLTICHQLNRAYIYYKYWFSFRETDNTFIIYLRIDALNLTSHDFLSIINMCFTGTRLFNDAMTCSEDSSEEEKFDSLRNSYLCINAEMAHEAEIIKKRKPYAVSPNKGTIGEYLSYLFDGEEMVNLLELHVQKDDNLQIIKQRDLIEKFNLFDAVMDYSDKIPHFYSTNPVVLSLEAATNHYVFTLHPLSDNEKFATLRMTAVRTPHEYLQDYVPTATYQPQAFSMILCYLKDEIPGPNEVDDIPTTSFSKQLKHGQNLMYNQYYLQAIAVLTPVYQQLKMKISSLPNKDVELFHSTCYSLGFCYMSIRNYEKAFFYLHIVFNCRMYTYSMALVNCLTDSHDVRVFNYIDLLFGEIDEAIKEIDNNDDRGTEEMMDHRERLVDFYAFLQRRKGDALIHSGNLTQAEQIFKTLLDHDKSHDYAERQLKHIESLKHNTNK